MKLRAKNLRIMPFAGEVEVAFSFRPAGGDAVEELKALGDDIAVELKKYRKPRSRNANSYCWELIGRLEEVTGIPALDIYRRYIRESGVYRLLDISESAVDTFRHSWGLHGLGWVCDVLDYGEHEGMRTIRAYYGSSAYNTKQMSRLIDSIVEDCKELGIETMTPAQLDLLKEDWGRGKKQTDESA